MRTPLLVARPLTALATLAALLGGCGENGSGPTEPAGPTPGLLRVQLTAPTASEGAVMLSITGPALPTAVTATQAGVVVHVRQTNDGITVALFGTIAGGELLRMRVPDVRAAAGYQVTVREVAGTDNALHDDLTPYRTSIDRVR